MTRSDTKNENARSKYQAAIEKNLNEGEVLWNRYNVMFAVNGVFISAIVLNQDKTNFILSSYILPSLGLITCNLWYQMTSRCFQWIHFWAITARKIEKTYFFDDCEELNPFISGNEHKSQIIGWPKTENGALLLIDLIALLYFAIIVYNTFIYLLPFLPARI